MAGRAKKDAREAIAELEQYLRRDTTAMDRLKAVDRYMVQLRQEKTRSTEQVESLSATVEELRRSIARTEDELIRTKQELSRTDTLEIQAVARLATANEKVSALETQLNIETECRDLPGDVPMRQQKKVQEFRRLLKNVRRRFRSPPMTSGLRKHQAYDIADFVKECSSTEYMNLGMFVTVLAWSGFGCGFRVETESRLGGMGEKAAKKFIQWIRDWIGGDPKYEEIVRTYRLNGEDDKKIAVHNSHRVKSGRYRQSKANTEGKRP